MRLIAVGGVQTGRARSPSRRQGAGMVWKSSPSRQRLQGGFTLIEILVVVAIITLLVAILIPSLMSAKEQTRRAKCLSNMSQLGKGVMLFAVAHQGRGQLYADWDLVDAADPAKTRYAYQSGWFENGTLRNPERSFLKTWPVAYASELGINSLKYNHHYFMDETTYLNGYPETEQPAHHFKRYGKYEPFYCPSDGFSIRETNSPEHVYGVLSYAINEDLFGARKNASYSREGWKDQAQGVLERAVRPAEVAMFTDTGHEQLQELEAQKSDGTTSIKAGGWVPTWFYSGEGATHLNEVSARAIVAVPIRRHGPKAGICLAYADGHGSFIFGNGAYVQSKGFPTRYSDKPVLVPQQYVPASPRVSPYAP